MRFCMVTTFYPPYSFGGDAVYVRQLSRALLGLGHEVDVVHCLDAFALRARSPDTPPVEEPGIRVHRLYSRLGPLSPLVTQQTGRPGLKRRKLTRILDDGYDVLHFHNISLVGGPAVLALGTARVKLLTLHDHWLICAKHVFWKNNEKACDAPTCLRCCVRSGIPPQLWRYGKLRQRSLKAVDRVIAPSMYTARRHREAGLEQVPIEILPHFSDLEPDERIRPAPSSPRFLYVGRLERLKGVHELVRMFKAWPQWPLDVVGDGSLRGTLLDMASDAPHIRIIGPVPHHALRDHYRQATALVAPSLVPETFGLTVVEAMAHGTPALVNGAAGGAREIVDMTGAGLVYHDAATGERALASLVSDSRLRETLAARAREGYRAHYTKERHLEGYLALIESLLARNELARCASS